MDVSGQMLREYAQHDSNHLRWFFVTLFGCSLLFLPLLNGQWVRSGDGEVYLGLARHLALGKGYTFNGEPVAILPPLWPMVLAGAMNISTRWWFLKLVPMGCMAGFLGISYWVLLRFTTPRRSAAVTLLSALLAQIYPLAIYFFSDALFALLAMLCVLLAMQINEGKSPAWRTIAIPILAAASVAVRWNGVLWWLMIAAAVLRGYVPFFKKGRLTRTPTPSPGTPGEGGGEGLGGGRDEPGDANRPNPHPNPSTSRSPRTSEYRARGSNNACSICDGLAGVACAAAFVALRIHLRVRPDQLDPRYDTFLAGAYSLINTPQSFHELLVRTGLIGEWIEGLLWNLVFDWRMIRPVGLVGGWIVLISCTVVLIDGLRARTWIWLAAAMQLLVLAFDWPHPMPRYLLPIAPMFILAAWNGFEKIGLILGGGKAMQIGVKVCTILFIASLIGINAIEYAMDAWAMRSNDFYRHYEGGVNRSFIAASRLASEITKPDEEIAITYQIHINGRPRTTAGPMRTFNFLTDRPVMLAPDELCATDPATNPSLAQWAIDHHVRCFLWQPPIEVFYHFRGSPWKPKGFDEGDYDWRVYELIGSELQQIPVSKNEPEMRVVPAM